MKALIHPDGTVELEIHNGDGQAALDLIRSLQGASEVEQPAVDAEQVDEPEYLREELLPMTAAELTVYDALLALGADTPGEAVHVGTLAQYMKLGRGIVNARCVSATNRGWLTRHRKGVYWVSAQEDQ